jgi:hypothetical protein
MASDKAEQENNRQRGERGPSQQQAPVNPDIADNPGQADRQRARGFTVTRIDANIYSVHDKINAKRQYWQCPARRGAA